MKLRAMVILLTCISYSVRADDQPTPSPTPIYLHHLAPPGTLRRAEQLDRQHALQTESQTRAEAREQAKANRRLTAAAEAQARSVARDKERAQRQVDEEARREAAKATAKPTSELMKQMGFSEEEIAAQKAREDSTKGGAKSDTTSQTEHRADQSKSSAATAEKPASASPAPQGR